MAKTMKSIPAGDVDDYISGFPKDIQKMLEAIRTTIQKAAPDAEEAIKYNIPTFRLNGNLVSFAAFKNHMGLYPAPRGVEEFKKEIPGPVCELMPSQNSSDAICVRCFFLKLFPRVPRAPRGSSSF